MHEAAADLRFEYAARLRDEINDLKRELRERSLVRIHVLREFAKSWTAVAPVSVPGRSGRESGSP